MPQQSRVMTFRGTHEHSLVEDWMKDVPGFGTDVLEPKDELGYTVSYVVEADAADRGPSDHDTDLSVCQGGELACPCSAAL
ncbi:hypothetical protein GA0004736_1380 [Curtobacterium sp. 9128]|uniref:hypothetical protein n=1 Tax=Curtobacterium sp. 9128 TaxID=1793722 RepID=UPI0007D71FA1|nr:hypothetical protein [Curtobacterium sp. 9128]SBN62478.1 hypothetical protein GA0004736_1380 [Curtobacterium sp. 9128]